MVTLSHRILFTALSALGSFQAACAAAAPQPRLTLSAGVQAPPAVFTREGKRLVYEDSGGAGPVVVCLPGMGDTRAQYRALAPRLVAAGYRVLALDPRGQGESDTGWHTYAPEKLGADTAALLAHLGLAKVYLVGNSYGAAAAAWIAAAHPAALRGLVLIGPFVYDMPIPWYKRAMLHALFDGPWAAAVWAAYYKSLYAAAPPADLDAYAAALRENLRGPGRLDALRAMLWASKGAVAARLGDVRAPALVVMGEEDPDFPDPAAEARHVARLVRGEVALVPAAGHYPHVEAPDATLEHLTRFFDAR